MFQVLALTFSKNSVFSIYLIFPAYMRSLGNGLFSLSQTQNLNSWQLTIIQKTPWDTIQAQELLDLEFPRPSYACSKITSNSGPAGRISDKHIIFLFLTQTNSFLSKNFQISCFICILHITLIPQHGSNKIQHNQFHFLTAYMQNSAQSAMFMVSTCWNGLILTLAMLQSL